MQCHPTYLYIRPLTIVLVGDGSDMFCGGMLRLGRTVVEADKGVGYERPLVSLLTRAATSIDGGGFNGGGCNGCCRSCARDIAVQRGAGRRWCFPGLRILWGSAFQIHRYRHEARR